MATKAKLGWWRITVAGEQCSLCGACAQWCGPAALALQQGDGQATLRFAAERCPGCGLCVQACPEKAIELTELSSPAAAGTAAVLASSPLSSCARCGTPSVPSRMLGSMARWNQVIGGGDGGHSGNSGEADTEVFTTCLACRSDMMFSGGSLHV